MQFLTTLCFLSIWQTSFFVTNCLPSSSPASIQTQNAPAEIKPNSQPRNIETSLVPYDAPPTPLHARTTNPTTTPTLRGRRNRIEYLDFSFLIWSDAHTHLLKQMTNDFYNAALSAARTLPLAAHYGWLTFSYGAFALSLYYIDKSYLIEAILDILDAVFVMHYPILYTIWWTGVVWAEVYFRGLYDGVNRMPSTWGMGGNGNGEVGS